jgi:hypothetical protein
LLASSLQANGHFEVYWDGVGLFLSRVDGAPVPRKLVLFLGLGMTFSGQNVGQGRWSDVHVFRDGCLLNDTCESMADGHVWIDALDAPPKRMSGKYEINSNGKLLKGAFVAKSA